MEYRFFPNDSVRVSTVGIGGTMLQNVSEEEMSRILDVAEEKGVNVIDFATGSADSFLKVGKALSGRRDKFVLCLHLGLTFTEEKQYERTRDLARVKESFNKQLSELGTDYADIAYIHYVDDQKDLEAVFSNGIYDYAIELKKEGRIGKLGFTSHQESICKMFLERGEFDLFMFSINPAYDLNPVANNPLDEDLSAKNAIDVAKERAALYQQAKKSGVGITVMKALGAGRLLKAETSPFKRALTIPQCIQYCLDRPAVLSCIIGVDSVDNMLEMATYDEKSFEERDYSFISSMQFEEMLGKCVYCNHCLPCPVNIDVASVNKFYDLALIGDKLAEEHYMALDHKASECIACGSCEKNCPFGVSIIERMKATTEFFGV